MNTCTIDGCDKNLRSPGAIYCKMHYHRWYRHGSPHKVATGSGVTASRGRRYRTVVMHGHPLARANGKVYVHRAALYDALDGNDAACHYCATPLRWSSTRGDADVLQVDHLNDDGADNRPENLVPCCAPCNTAKAQARRHLALRAAGYWSTNDTIAALRSPDQRRVGFDLALATPQY